MLTLRFLLLPIAVTIASSAVQAEITGDRPPRRAAAGHYSLPGPDRLS